MSEERLPDIERLFQRAADLPAEERTAFLDREADDAAVRSRVEAMLKEMESGDSLSRFDFHVDADDRGLEGPGTIIDRYKLLQRIGEGGFGVVYMAEQSEPVIRKVALKIIKLGMDTKEVVARFEAERQALAMMDHPNIARVLDGGATATGRPYFAMELVRGVSITEYCDTNNLSTRDRLDLFEMVCHAVQHAHQKGVIHRDIKPSNVLVTLHDGKPVPKVIDFGIAKAMHSRLTEKTLFTNFRHFIGTPAYMSPEQAQMSALDVDTRTDIYSLGVLLYELLTGSTPFDSESLMRAGLDEIKRVIREDDPPRPSLRISETDDATIAQRHRADVPTLSRYLRGDLDWIVMKALEKERGRRYETASAFAADVRRHLENEPVEAGPPGTAYRLRKFLIRNRAAVVSFSVIALSLVGGIIGIVFAMLEAGRQRDEAVLSRSAAETETEHARLVLQFLDHTLSLADPEVALDRDLSVKTLLARAAENATDSFAKHPAAEARVQATIGRAFASLGEYERADVHLRRAADLIGREGSFDDTYAYYRLLWSLTEIAFRLERADAYAWATRARAVGHDYLRDGHPELADHLDTFIQEVGVAARSAKPEAWEGTQASFDAASRLADRDLASDDQAALVVADSLMHGGYSLWYSPHDARTAQLFVKALELQRRVHPPSHPVLGETVSMLVGVLNRSGRPKEGEAAVRENIRHLRDSLPEGHWQIAFAESLLGESLVHQRRFESAEKVLLQSLETLAAIWADEKFTVIETITRLIMLYDAWEKPAKAAPYRDRLADIYARAPYSPQWSLCRPLFSPDDADVADRLEAIENLCGQNFLIAPGLAKPEGLDAALDRALPLSTAGLETAGPLGTTIARMLLRWGGSLEPSYREARRRLAEESLAVLRLARERAPLSIAEALGQLAEVAYEEGRTAEARALVDQAIPLVRDLDHRRHASYVSSTCVRVARALLLTNRLAEAERVLLPSCENLLEQLGPDHSDVKSTRALLVRLYDAMGTPEKAAPFR